MYNETKVEALRTLKRVEDAFHVPPSTIDVIRDGITDIELLRDRDERLEEMWAQFADIPMDPETECIEAPFMGWGPGVHREEIWHWFDKRHSKGVAYLLYGDGAAIDSTEKIRRIEALCKECGSADCVYNKAGRCMYPRVHEAEPVITELDGCKNYLYIGGGVI